MVLPSEHFQQQLPVLYEGRYDFGLSVRCKVAITEKSLMRSSDVLPSTLLQCDLL